MLSNIYCRLKQNHIVSLEQLYLDTHVISCFIITYSQKAIITYSQKAKADKVSHLSPLNETRFLNFYTHITQLYAIKFINFCIFICQ